MFVSVFGNNFVLLEESLSKLKFCPMCSGVRQGPDGGSGLVPEVHALRQREGPDPGLGPVLPRLQEDLKAATSGEWGWQTPACLCVLSSFNAVHASSSTLLDSRFNKVIAMSPTLIGFFFFAHCQHQRHTMGRKHKAKQSTCVPGRQPRIQWSPSNTNLILLSLLSRCLKSQDPCLTDLQSPCGLTLHEYC